MARPESEQHGFTRIYYRGGGTRALQRADHDPLITAWKAGRPFFEGHDLYGDEVTIRLDDVSDVTHVTPRGMAGFDAEAEAHNWDDDRADL
jgi:hypothetical protein